MSDNQTGTNPETNGHAEGNGHPVATAARIAAMQKSGTEFAKEWIEKPPPNKDPRYLALRNFAISITFFNVIGYPLLGFEQPWLWPFLAVATAYTVELLLETLAAWAYQRPAAYRGRGPRGLIEFLLPAHITGLAFNFLVYAHNQLWPVLFGVTVAVGAKWVIRAKINGKMKHFMNPSNFGIVVCMLLFPMMAVAPPYHFTEHLHGPVRWGIVIALFTSGTLLNAKLTLKMPLILAWFAAFALQAILRGWFEPNISMLAAIAPMTGLAFILFSNYMVTDPATTPFGKRQQIMFGASVGVLYGVFMVLHIAYGLFFALTVTCASRGIYWWVRDFAEWRRSRVAGAAEPAPAPEALALRAHSINQTARS
ncbi:hypothetical protein JMUB6875_44180 [Nocardia sp. JMUB6875]|uniref:enediyne biosynthesis protein n=1 Tax=Nocardia sp. JMUB6875 TaxID=3158170 RepID=UPI0032E636CE